VSYSEGDGEGGRGGPEVPVDTNLIQLDDDLEGGHGGDDDIIFEDFARLRLKGHEADDVDV
jgi:beta-arrestin